MPSQTKDMKDISQCVVCGKWLRPGRTHVDTCGERCFKKLLALQRKEAEHGKENLRTVRGNDKP